MVTQDKSTDVRNDMKEAPNLTEFEIYNNNIRLESLPIFTRNQLSFHNGIERPTLYVSIKGHIYDVTENGKNYGPGKSYNRLVGKDVTRLLGHNKLQLHAKHSEDKGIEWSTWYYGDFTEKQHSLVDKWVIFFRKRYKIVGLLVNHEARSSVESQQASEKLAEV